MAISKDDSAKARLDSLLAEMPRIAEAVKAFPETVQPQAFERLMAELTGHAVSAAGAASASRRAPRRRGGFSRANAPMNEGKRGRPRTGGPTTVRDLDLAPKGKKSLKELVSEKHPNTNHDKNAVSVYYLAEILRLTDVTLDHVFTCYKDMRWREPGKLANSLALTASRKRYLDTANLSCIRLTPAGRNHVEHDLPPKKKE